MLQEEEEEEEELKTTTTTTPTRLDSSHLFKRVMKNSNNT